jgi:hypothetical protein
MPESPATTLLAALDPLDFPARMRLLAQETRRLADEGGLDPVLDEFAAGDVHLRQLALTMAKISQRTDRLIAALDDPLYRIRLQALSACVRVPDEQTESAILATLDDAPLAWRRDLVRAVSAAKRADFADRLVEGHRARLGEPDTARLLASCSAEVAARLLPELDHLVPNWPRLGARHPALMLDFARSELAAMPAGSRDRWWASVGAGIIAAAAHLPLRVLDLLEEFPLQQGLPYAVLRKIHVLVRADEGRTLRVLTAPDGRLTHRWRLLSQSSRKRLATSGRPEIELVGRTLWESPADFARLLRSLRPSARSAFYDAATADRETSRAILPPAVLDALPRARRHAEARRMLALSALTDRPDQRLAVVARLPWAEALPDLRTAVRQPDPDDRELAYPLLIACAAASGSPAEVTELLTGELGRLRNEQDPVRQAALRALATVPPDLFEDTEAVTDALTRLVVDSAEARDGSGATRDALRLLSCRILAQYATDDSSSSGLLTWALTVFEQLAGVTGAFQLGLLDRSLRRGQEFAVHRALAPWIERGIERADHRLVLALAQALGRRAWAIPGLQSSVAHAIWHGTTGTSRHAIGLWLADPAHRDERTAEVVAWDPTAAVIGRVADVLSLRRTDLLDGYLTGEEPLKGRFIARGAIWVPALSPSYRWQPRQLTAYARLLAKIAADAGATVHARVAAIRSLGAFPGDEQQRVLRYLDSTNVPLAEAALGALAWSEDPAAALPVLLEYADGDRARVAVYAANRAARFARPSAAAPMLRSVALSTSAKVTSRKEVLRIAAELEIPDLVDLLVEVWRVPGQHRDVKAAVASRLAGQMDDPRVPPLLREAAADDPAISAPLLRTNPHDLPERHRAAYGELIAEVCGIEDPKAAGVALAAAPAWYRWTDSVAMAICTAVTDLDRRGDRTASPSSLFALLGEGMPIDQYVAVLDSLLDADAQDTEPVDRSDQDWPDRDRPARRRLTSIAQGAAGYGRSDPDERRVILRATAGALTGRAGFVSLATDLAAAAVDLKGSPEVLTRELLALADRAADRYDAATRAGNRILLAITHKEPWRPTSVLAAAEALARRTDPAAGQIALRLTASTGAALGWPGSFRQVVSTLRRHPDPTVAEAALELDTGTA